MKQRRVYAGALERQRAAIAVGYFFALAGLVFGSWAARLADVKERLDASPGPLGAAMLCTAAGSLTSMALAPRMIRRFGVPTFVVGGGVGCCAFLAVAASSRSLGVLAVALLGMGLSSGALSIGIGLQAVAFERQAGRAIVTRFHGCHSAGGLLGALIGAAMSTWLDPTMHLTAVALAGLVGVAALRTWLPGGELTRTVAIAPTAVVNRRLLAASSLAWCAAFGEGTVVAWAAVHLREEIGTTSAVAALGFAALAAAMVVVRAAGPIVFERLPTQSALCAAGWITAVGGVLVAAGPNASAAIAGCALVGAGVALVFPTATATGDVSQLGAVRGMRLPSDAFAVAVMIGSSGALLSGPIVGLVAELAGTRAGFACVAVAGAAIAVLARHLPQRVASVPSPAAQPELAA